MPPGQEIESAHLGLDLANQIGYCIGSGANGERSAGRQAVLRWRFCFTGPGTRGGSIRDGSNSVKRVSEGDSAISQNYTKPRKPPDVATGSGLAPDVGADHG